MKNDLLEEDEYVCESPTKISQKDIGLVIKLTLTITFVVSFAVLLTAFLTYFNFSRSYSDITQARYIVLGGDLKKSIEYSLNVGVNIDELRNAQALVEGFASKNADIAVLQIVSENKEVLYGKDKATLGAKSLVSMKDSMLIDNSDYRIVKADNIIVLSMPIFNNFSAKVGELRIGYSNQLENKYLDKTRWFLLQHSILSISIVSMLVLILVYFITKKFRKRLADMGYALAHLMDDSHHDPDEITERGNFENSYLVFHEKTQELLLSFDAATRDLDELERNSSDV